MQDFINWCATNNLTLPDVDAVKNENGKRTGLRPGYPEGYVRNQYPDGYFAPISATAFLDLKNSKKTKEVKGAGETPLK